jgi:hypothetical protein
MAQAWLNAGADQRPTTTTSPHIPRFIPENFTT